MKRILIVTAIVVAVASPTLARAPMTDAQVRQAIIQKSVAQYHATGHPCACPYDVERNGRSCGRVSAYSRPGGAAPMCYPRDVSPGMVLDWRRGHQG
jgi:hypothetical protein